MQTLGYYGKKCLKYVIMPKKDTDRIANSDDPDLTSSLGTV